MELIEKRVQDALSLAGTELSVIRAWPGHDHTRGYLEGQQTAYHLVLRWLAAYKQAHANHLMDVLDKDMARILHEEDE